LCRAAAHGAEINSVCPTLTHPHCKLRDADFSDRWQGWGLCYALFPQSSAAKHLLTTNQRRKATQPSPSDLPYPNPRCGQRGDGFYFCKE